MTNVKRAAIAVIFVEILLVIYVLLYAPLIKADDEPEMCYSDLECEMLFNKKVQLAKAECTHIQDVIPIPDYRGNYYECDGTIIEETE